MIPTIPGHRVIRPIGSGSMGMVYLAEQESLGRQVALKVLYPHHARNRERRERFFNEARLMANLIHPNIVQLFSLVEADGDIVIVMEYVHGRNMDTIIGSEIGPIPHEKALPLISDMLKGLGYAHSSGIVHRDIKPGNVLVSADHVAKVTDFGVAKLVGQKGLTKAGAQVGTLAYMSPEQVLGKDVDQRSDIYSLGVTLYEMLAGRLPIDGHEISDMEFMNMILNESMPDPRDFYPDIPEWLVAIVYKAIEKKPERRFSSCEEFLGQIEMGLSIGSVSIPMRKPFLRRFSSGLRSLFSRPGNEMPEYVGGSGSSSGGVDSRGGSSARYLGETQEERKQRKREQLKQLMDRSREVALEEEKSLAEEYLDEIAGISSGESTEGENGEGSSDGHTVYSPEELSESREKEIEQFSDPLDGDNEPSSIRRFFAGTAGKVSSVAAIAAAGLIGYFFIWLPSSEADDVSSIPVRIIPFTHSLRIQERIDGSAVLVGEVTDAVVSADGKAVFGCSGFIHVYDPLSMGWASAETDVDNPDIAYLPDGSISYSNFNTEESALIIADTSLNEVNRIGYDLSAPFNIIWFTDTSFCGTVPELNPGETAGYSISRFDSEGDQVLIYAHHLTDISDYPNLWNLPSDLVYKVYTDLPITAFSSDRRAYVSSSDGDSYRIDVYSEAGTLVDSIVRTVTPVPKSTIDIDQERASFEARMGAPPPDGWPLALNRPCIVWMGVDAQDRLWVLRGNTTETQFDVYGPDGDLIVELVPDLPQDGIPWSFSVNGSNILAYRTEGGSLEAYYMEFIDEEKASELLVAFFNGELSL